MVSALPLIEPELVPPLDPDFRPAVLANRALRQEAAAAGAAVPLVIALERSDGAVSRYETIAFAADHPQAEANLPYAERLVKFLLWAARRLEGHHRRAGRHRRAHPPRLLADRPARLRLPLHGRAGLPGAVHRGRRAAADDAPQAREAGQALGRHLDGCRIGFDLGASDLKVSAVIDGEPIWSDEIVWEPVEQRDPAYHYQRITRALRLAAEQAAAAGRHRRQLGRRLRGQSAHGRLPLSRHPG